MIFTTELYRISQRFILISESALYNPVANKKYHNERKH